MEDKPLRELLDGMSVPEMRKSPTEANLRWLQRNLRINNGASPEVETALKLIKKLLNEM